jgi:hypothetical protein
MIIVKMQGGLANKMFQYAFYKNLESKGLEVYVDDISFKPRWDFEDMKLSEVFPNIKINYATLKDIKRLGGGGSIVDLIKRKIIKRNTFIDERDKKPSFYERIGDDLYLQGTWSNEAYFRHIGEKIRNDFKFKEFINKKNIDLCKKFANEESVAIHFRKGKDYDNPLMRGTCDKFYYQEAIDYIKNKIANPKFYVFTDNKDWVQKNIKNLSYTLIDWNPIAGLDNYIDMQLMSLVKHNIIANSTYSWWGAWLNNNPKKIVVGPKNWFNPINEEYKEKNSQKIPKDWIAL